MRYLFRGDQELTGDDLARLDALDGLYAPQAAALRAELLALLGDSAAAEAAAAVRQTWPALSWWIDDVEAGAGTIAWERRLRPHAS